MRRYVLPSSATISTPEGDYWASSKANLKFSGSRFERYFKPQNFPERYAACTLTPLNIEVAEIMTTDFEVINFHIDKWVVRDSN
jgi:hypothetical protein